MTVRELIAALQARGVDQDSPVLISFDFHLHENFKVEKTDGDGDVVIRVVRED
jgi:molecular chaperone GrpE (heat shock protein)